MLLHPTNFGGISARDTPNLLKDALHTNATIRQRMTRLLILLLLTPLAGCGYHQAGSATHIPANVRTLAVPIFATKAQSFHTEMLFTQSTIRELNTRTRYRILNSDIQD